jgi:hypothetical protein
LLAIEMQMEFQPVAKKFQTSVSAAGWSPTSLITADLSISVWLGNDYSLFI